MTLANLLHFKSDSPGAQTDSTAEQTPEMSPDAEVRSEKLQLDV